MGRRVGSREGRLQRNANAFEKSRTGQSSLSPGKLGTPGRGLMAKAPRLRKDRRKGTQRTRKLSTVYSVEAGERRRDASWCVPGRRTAGAEPYAVKAARTVLNGGDEDTCGSVTRLVPIQLPRSRSSPRLMPGVRRQRRGAGHW